MGLFQRGNFILHSGEYSEFKIDADALTDDDIETIACLINENLPLNFSSVEGVPTGGLRLAKAMEKYIYTKSIGPILIVDDVYTSGASMEKQKAGRENVMGAVIFARNKPEPWIISFLTLFAL